MHARTSRRQPASITPRAGHCPGNSMGRSNRPGGSDDVAVREFSIDASRTHAAGPAPPRSVDLRSGGPGEPEARADPCGRDSRARRRVHGRRPPNAQRHGSVFRTPASPPLAGDEWRRWSRRRRANLGRPPRKSAARKPISCLRPEPAARRKPRPLNPAISAAHPPARPQRPATLFIAVRIRNALRRGRVPAMRLIMGLE